MCGCAVAWLGGVLLVGNLIGWSLARAADQEMPTPPSKERRDE